MPTIRSGIVSGSLKCLLCHTLDVVKRAFMCVCVVCSRSVCSKLYRQSVGEVPNVFSVSNHFRGSAIDENAVNTSGLLCFVRMEWG